MKINKEWHLAHKMLKNPTNEQRIQWHIEHSKHCQCRALTPKLQKEIEDFKSTQKEH